MRGGPQSLSQRNRDPLAGDVYRMFVEVYRNDPGEPSSWVCLKGLNRAVREGRIAGAPTLDPRKSDDVAVARDWFGIDLTDGGVALGVAAKLFQTPPWCARPAWPLSTLPTVLS